MRIAYVEDNLTNYALIERVAKMSNHALTSYTEGEVALEALKVNPFDLILMDVELAGEMTGLDLVKALRAFGLKTPIIAVTAYAMLGDRERCLEAGCNDYLPKPLPIMDLIAMLAKYDEITKANGAHPPSEPIAKPEAEKAQHPEATPEAPTAKNPEPTTAQSPEAPKNPSLSQPPDVKTSG
jgi:CheY-like chemotaxis protein